jgi:hypothetical protein
MKYIKNESYEDYKDKQTALNKAKFHAVWITMDEINSVVNYVHNSKLEITNGICHGARNGFEVNHFRNKLNANIIGTDISDTANHVDNMIQWDMHDRNEDWIDYFDFIYSNSIDHSYDFDKCLDTWMESLKLTGRLFIEWNPEIDHPWNYTDCFGITQEELINLINVRYSVTDVFPVNGHSAGTVIIVIKHKQ